jgi:DNA adenine methylase
MLEELMPRTPREIGTYYEPFVGGGAMLFALLGAEEPPAHAVINDRNVELMAAYEVVRDDVDTLIERLAVLEEAYLAGDEDGRAAYFYAVREEQPDPADQLETAARLVFLNRTCFNGLYRVNRSGRFNVPHGRYRNPRIVDEAALRATSEALSATDLLAADFEEACASAVAGDFVYFDPPFYPLSATSSFTEYTQGAFLKEEQKRLRWLIDELTDRGVNVMLSNSPAEFMVGLYEGAQHPDRPREQRYDIAYLPSRRAINARGDGRGPIDELLVTNYSRSEARGPFASDEELED